MPLVEEYQPDFGEKIISGFKGRGWNIYTERGHPDKTISNGPAGQLEIDVVYMVLPLVDEPKNPEKVMDALTRYGYESGKKAPQITIVSQKHTFISLELKKNCIELLPLSEVKVAYGEFINSIDSLDQWPISSS